MSTLDSIPQLVTLLKDCTGQIESKKNDASPFVIFQTLGALHGFMGGQITALQAQITALQAKKSHLHRNHLDNYANIYQIKYS